MSNQASSNEDVGVYSLSLDAKAYNIYPFTDAEGFIVDRSTAGKTVLEVRACMSCVCGRVRACVCVCVCACAWARVVDSLLIVGCRCVGVFVFALWCSVALVAFRWIPTSNCTARVNSPMRSVLPGTWYFLGQKLLLIEGTVCAFPLRRISRHVMELPVAAAACACFFGLVLACVDKLSGSMTALLVCFHAGDGRWRGLPS